MFVRRDWRYAAGRLLRGWLPWFAGIDRQMLRYAATSAISGDGHFAGSRRLSIAVRSSEQRTLGLIAVCCYVALVVTNAWLSVLTGLPISQQTGTWRSGCPAGGDLQRPARGAPEITP